MQIGPKYSNTHTHTLHTKYMHGCIHVSNQGAATTLLSASHLAILIVSLRAPPPHPSARRRPISAILHHAMLSFATLCCKLSPCLSQQTQPKQRNASSTLADNVCMCLYFVCVYCMLNVPTLLLLFLAAPSVVAQPFDGLTNSAAVGQFEGTVGRTSTFITQLCQFAIKSTNTFCIQLETVKTSLAINHS